MNPLALLAPMLLAMVAPVANLPNRARALGRALATDEDANLDMSKGLSVVGIVLGAVITMVVIANLFPTFADAVADVNTNLTDDTVTFGDETADGLKPVFAIVIGITALLGIVGIILGAFRGRLDGS